MNTATIDIGGVPLKRPRRRLHKLPGIAGFHRMYTVDTSTTQSRSKENDSWACKDACAACYSDLCEVQEVTMDVFSTATAGTK
jgi:hypothetical protein